MGLSESLGKKKDKAPEKRESKPSRVRLEWINGVPRVQDTRVLLAEAQKNQGMPCELPIRAVLGVFLLSCQSDHLSTEPCWTLYEGEDGSKQVWSYMNENPDMITDIVGMSVTNKDAKTQVDMPTGETAGSPAVVPSGSPPAAASNSSYQPAESQAAAAPYTPAAQPYSPAAAQYAQPAPAPAPLTPDPNQPYDPYVGWSTPQPGGQPPEQPVQPQAGGWNNQPTPADNLGQQQAPYDPSRQSYQSLPPQGQPQGWGANTQQSQTSGWGAAAAQAQSGWGSSAPQAQPPGWGAAAAQPADSPWIQGSGSAGNANANSTDAINRFIKSLDSRPEVTIGELSMDPTLPPICVDAALKLQEMVLTGHFADKVALQALKLVALNNGVLDDGIILRAKTAVSLDPNELARQAAAVLQHAGLLTDADITFASNNLAKHNNSFAEALISSGKVDKLVLEAAQDCQPLLTEGRMRQDQAIIALHYCHRSRAKLKDAIEDLSIELL